MTVKALRLLSSDEVVTDRQKRKRVPGPNDRQGIETLPFECRRSFVGLLEVPGPNDRQGIETSLPGNSLRAAPRVPGPNDRQGIETRQPWHQRIERARLMESRDRMTVKALRLWRCRIGRGMGIAVPGPNDRQGIET